MTKTVIVTGIPGTGKTTLCNLVQKLSGKAGAAVKMVINADGKQEEAAKEVLRALGVM